MDKKRVHKLHQALKAIEPISRSHVYELLAAAHGFRTYAAMIQSSEVRAPNMALLTERAQQLGYSLEVVTTIWNSLRQRPSEIRSSK